MTIQEADAELLETDGAGQAARFEHCRRWLTSSASRLAGLRRGLMLRAYLGCIGCAFIHRGRELARRLPMTIAELTPMLTVRDARAASSYYQQAFGATERSRFASPSGQFVIELAIGSYRFFAVDENADAFNVSPDMLGGTSVRLNLIVDDPDAMAARAVDAGAKVLFPVADQPYGMRQGRVVDPFGHHWLVGKPLDLTASVKPERLTPAAPPSNVNDDGH